MTENNETGVIHLIAEPKNINDFNEEITKKENPNLDKNIEKAIKKAEEEI